MSYFMRCGAINCRRSVQIIQQAMLNKYQVLTPIDLNKPQFHRKWSAKHGVQCCNPSDDGNRLCNPGVGGRDPREDKQFIEKALGPPP